MTRCQTARGGEGTSLLVTRRQLHRNKSEVRNELSSMVASTVKAKPAAAIVRSRSATLGKIIVVNILCKTLFFVVLLFFNGLETILHNLPCAM